IAGLNLIQLVKAETFYFNKIQSLNIDIQRTLLKSGEKNQLSQKKSPWDLMESIGKIVLLLYILSSLTVHRVLSREKDLLKDVDRYLKEPLGAIKEGSLVGKYLNDFATPTKYIAYALGYYNVTVELESRVEALLELDYSKSLTQSAGYVLLELSKIVQKLRVIKLRSQDDYREVETEALKRFVTLTDAIHQQFEETKTLIEKDFRSVNKELKIWLEFQKKFTENWKNINKYGITLYEKEDEKTETLVSAYKVDSKIVMTTIQTLTGIYEAYVEIDRMVDKLEGQIAADKESGVFHKNYDNAYINIMKLDQALFGIVQGKNKTLSKFKKVSDAARNRMKSLVQEHDLKYVNTLQDIDILSQKVSKTVKTFQKYLRNKTFSNQRFDDEDLSSDAGIRNNNRIEL
ncbi:unnamed protein product, partial [Allacma fusca]